MGTHIKIILLFTIGLVACKTTHQDFSSTDKSLETLINKSIRYFGGMDKYNSLATLRYNKKVILYKEDGEIEREIFEEHNYNYRKENFLIKRKVGGADTGYRMKNGEYYSLENGLEKLSASVKKTFDTAFYVTEMPFKFLDKGADLSILEEKDNVVAIKATYNKSVHQNHAGNESWIYYLDKTSGNILHQIAYTSDHNSMVVNEKYHTQDGYKFIAERKSYRVDEDHNILYKRADYWYYDIDITFE